MPITPEQREERKKHVGSSDIAPILGVSPWKTAYDCWLEKTGKLEDGEITNEAMELGNELEPIIINRAEKILGELTRDFQVSADCKAPLVVNIDAVTKAEVIPVEAKSTGIKSFYVDEAWGEEGTDEVPNYVTLQCHAHMIAVCSDICHVPTIIGGRGFKMFYVPRSEALVLIIIERVEEFWNDFVLKDLPPVGLPSLDFARRIRREPSKIIELPSSAMEKWIASKDALKAAAKIKDEADAELLKDLGTAEASVVLPEVGGVTFFENTAKRFDGKAFKEAHPDLFKKFLKETKSRSLKHKKPPKPKKGK